VSYEEEDTYLYEEEDTYLCYWIQSPEVCPMRRRIHTFMRRRIHTFMRRRIHTFTTGYKALRCMHPPPHMTHTYCITSFTTGYKALRYMYIYV
jgi:hypothetical protein